MQIKTDNIFAKTNVMEVKDEEANSRDEQMPPNGNKVEVAIFGNVSTFYKCFFFLTRINLFIRIFPFN